ncbi:PHP domain-containing protein [Candidatus Woesearchaeota archaeon]|nr:PHP domain-containing protein [Candidatus Woesearchaeota archaeon]
MNRVIFAKPDISELKKEGYHCVDMHCHSRYSDGLSKLHTIYKKCKKMGIGVALTDHNESKGAVKMMKYRDILVIPGIETTSKEGIHTLFYFYNAKELEEFCSKTVKKSLGGNPYSDLKASIIELVEAAGRYNCRICSAHPFGPWNTGIYKFSGKKDYKKLIKKIDFVEGINSSHPRESNIKAVKWGTKLGKTFTGGSDAHATMFIGKVVTATTGGKNFLDSISKESLVVGTEVNKALLALRHVLKLRMFSKFPKFYIKKIIREGLKKK